MPDIELTIDGTTRRFDLARNQGRKVWREEDTVAVPQAVVGASTYEAVRPDQLMVLGQRTWQGGYGRLFFSDEERDRYATGSNIDTSEAGKVFLGPLVNVVSTDLGNPPLDFVFFNGQEYVMTTDKVFRYNGTTFDEVFAAPLGKAFKDLEVFGTYIIVTLDSDSYYLSSTGDLGSWSQVSGGITTHFLGHAVPSSGATPLLAGAKTPNELRTATEVGAGADWTNDPFLIGDASGDITSLMLWNEFLLIGKEDGLYNLSSDGRAVPLLPELKVARNSRNFKYHTGWQSSLYFSIGDSLGEISYGGGYRGAMGPTDLSNLEERGYCVGLSADAQWLYAALYIQGASTRYCVFKGRERRSRDGLRWEWTPFIDLGANATQAMRVMQREGQNARLWLGYGTQVAYVILSDNPLGDINYRFAAQGDLDTGWFHGGYEVWTKIFTAVRVMARNLAAAAQQVYIFYDIDDGNGYQPWGSAISTDGMQAVYPTAPVAANKVRLRIRLTTTDSTKTPVVEGYWLKGVLKPETVRVFTFAVPAESHDSRRAKTIYDFLWSGRTSTSLVTLKDRLGVEHKVSFLPGSPQVVEVVDEAGREPTLAIQIAAQKVETG